jgi:hypothetical protein
MGGKEDRAILRETLRLARVFRSMADMAGLELERRHAPILTRASRNAILRLLRPAEAALCHLIVMVMHQMFGRDRRSLLSLPHRFTHSTPHSLARLFPRFAAEWSALSDKSSRLSPKSRPKSRLKSRLTRRSRLQPFNSRLAPFLLRRLREPSVPASRFATRDVLPAHSALPAHSRPDPNQPVSRDALCWRLFVLRHALKNLPAQARRLARWLARAHHGYAPLPRQLMRPRTVQAPPDRGKTRRSPADDTPAKGQFLPKGVEFLRWKLG